MSSWPHRVSWKQESFVIYTCECKSECTFDSSLFIRIYIVVKVISSLKIIVLAPWEVEAIQGWDISSAQHQCKCTLDISPYLMVWLLLKVINSLEIRFSVLGEFEENFFILKNVTFLCYKHLRASCTPLKMDHWGGCAHVWLYGTDMLDLHKLFASPAFVMQYCPKLKLMPNCFNLKLSNNASRFWGVAVLSQLFRLQKWIK